MSQALTSRSRTNSAFNSRSWLACVYADSQCPFNPRFLSNSSAYASICLHLDKQLVTAKQEILKPWRRRECDTQRYCSQGLFHCSWIKPYMVWAVLMSAAHTMLYFSPSFSQLYPFSSVLTTFLQSLIPSHFFVFFCQAFVLLSLAFVSLLFRLSIQIQIL